MAKTTRYEVFQDGEMIAAFDDLSKYEEVTDPIFENLVNQGYRFLQSSTCGYGGYSIYFNEPKLKVTIISYKQSWTVCFNHLKSRSKLIRYKVNTRRIK